MIVSEYNLYVPREILPLSKLMNPMNVVNAYFASLKIASVQLQWLEKELCTPLPPIPFIAGTAQNGLFQPSAVKTLHPVGLHVWEGQGQAELSFADVDAVYGAQERATTW